MGGAAIVTGGGTGVGRAVALALARRGFALVLAGRRAGPLEAVAGEIGAAGGRAIVVVTDITDERSVAQLFARAVAEHGRVDLLFNNAGAGPPPFALEDLPLDRWRQVVDVNLTGTFLCLREAFRVMKAQSPKGGRIINNGSLSAHTPRPNSAPYTATKHAVTGLTKTAALDGRKHNIAVGQIDIGNTMSEMAAPVTRGVPQADGETRPEPIMAAEDVAEMVAAMASLPLGTNVQQVTMLPSAMPFVGRG